MKTSKININIPSPNESVSHPLLKQESIQLSVKREDKIHNEVSGNKWRKLQYNLEALNNELGKIIITFGGAFSNHIYATAAVCKAYNIPSIGIIRGENDDQNPTLKFARSCGMEIKFVDRSSYREKAESNAVKKILKEAGNYKLIPEGGSNELALKGLRLLAKEINEAVADIILVSAGTGYTAAGILENLNPEKELWVFSSLKSDHFKEEILTITKGIGRNQLKVFSNYHFGGYGRVTNELVQFINDFKSQTKIPLDPIYNGKLMFGFFDLVKNQKIDTSKSYLWIHTGGLQGIDAYNYLTSKKGGEFINT